MVRPLVMARAQRFEEEIGIQPVIEDEGVEG
jgi:hypothetical protein